MPSAITVRAVNSRADRRRFVDFQYQFYRDSPYWVPPLRRDVYEILDPRKNPFFEHGRAQLFLATDPSGNVVGRIAAIINGMHLKKYNDGVGFFGFFECIENFDVASALFERAGEWLREQGLKAVRGPVNPSMNDTAGLLIDGFDREPSIMMPYNPPYHAEYLEKLGFERAMIMWAYYLHKKYVNVEKLKRGVEIVRRRHPTLRVRTLDMSRFEQEAQTILEIYNEAWSRNWGHVPMTDNEFAHLIKMMKQVVDPNIVFIVEDDGKPVAFSISLPNLNQALRHVPDGRLLPMGLAKVLAYSKFGGVNECRNLLMGVLHSHQGRGIDALINLELIANGPKHGYAASEMSWVLDANHVLRNALAAMNSVVDKQYAMYEKVL
jgi:GNAT superfamily N-acetyltransferase